MSVPIRILTFASLVFLISGCQTARPLYYWGQYEAVIYQGYANPGKLSLDEQILKLEEDVAKAAGTGLPTHPGLHAQLGFLYSSKGDAVKARAEFEAEKKLFPESTVMMDRMLEKLKPAST